jgi:alginate O-acetyltransferase complex protein AlgF
MFLLSLLAAAAAQDDLYAPAPPPDAAFVRVINAVPGGAPFAANVGGKGYTSLAYQQASPYRVVTGGAREARVGTVPAQNVDLLVGAFYTLAAVGDPKKPTLVLLRDEPNTNLAKALVCIYNLAGAPTVDLKTADGATALVTGVAPQKSGCRAVNPVKADFAAVVGSVTAGTFPGVQLDRGSVYAAFVTGTADKPVAAWVQGATQ